MKPYVHRYTRRLLLSVYCVLFLSALPLSCGTRRHIDFAFRKSLTPGDINALITAVKDEIYTQKYQTYYADVDKDKVAIYVQPFFENSLIWTIYKLLPHGEVYRAATMRKDGLAVLLGDPHNAFPATQGAAMKTVYLDDDEVIKMKTAWDKHYFAVEIQPSEKETRAAQHRQALRAGIAAQSD
jgi:hypothetical protein